MIDGFTDNLHLGFLHGESRVDEKNRVFPFLAFRGSHECGVASLHGAYRGDDAFRFDVDIHEVFHEFGTLFFEFLVSFEHGIELSASGTKGFDFGVDTYF